MSRKQAVLFYMKNMLNAPNFFKRGKEWILDFMDDSSVSILGWDISQKWGCISDNGNLTKNISIENLAPSRKILALRKIINKKKIIDINERGYDSKLDAVSDLFNIKPEYLPVLNLFFNLKRNNLVRRCLGFLFSRSLSEDLDPQSISTIAAICGTTESIVEKSFNRNNCLIKNGILYYTSSGHVALHSAFEKILSKNIKNQDDLKNALLGEKSIGKPDLDFSFVSKEYEYITKIIQKSVQKKTKGINILIYGKPGTGKTEFVKQLVTKLNYDLYGGTTENNTKNQRLAFLLQAQSILVKDKKSVLLVDEAEDIFKEAPFSESGISKLYLNNILENNSKPTIWITNNIACMDPAYIRRFVYCMEFKKPSDKNKRCVWRSACRQNNFNMSDEDISIYAQQYDVAPSIIDTAIRMAKITDSKQSVSTTIDSLCLAINGKKSQINKRNSVDFDIGLLNTDIDTSLLAERLSTCKNINFSLCLYGASGTGKTAYAHYLADKLGLKIIQKKVSDLTSHYVGQTEKNIAAAFAEAEEENAMLVFDEADSFLRDRKYARNSWEITSVNEMLTQMETTNIPFVCTTNLMNDMDAASLRRFTFKVKYDYMNQNQVKTAFSTFFDICLSEDNLIHDLTGLAPGDFSVVKRKMDILGAHDINEIIDMIKQEMQVKRIAPQKHIGFNLV